VSISPLLQRTYEQPLTLELLAKHVPAVKAGHEANERLRALDPAYKPATEAERHELNELRKTVRAGKKAQEILILSALPLIKNLASKEFYRRKAWSSRISYDDILQEAISGFIRGLLAFKPEETKSSPTNYLGQWIITNIRRKLEVMEHDFFIPYEIVERNRRIVAVRSRLTTELEREPTDQELLVALNDKEQRPGNKWGRSNGDASETPSKRNTDLTQEHLDASRALSTKLYSMQSNEPADAEEEGTYERSALTLSASEPMSVDHIEAESVLNSKRAFFHEVFIMMRVGSKQRDIILRFFGMQPYEEPQNYREIVQNTGLSSRFVKNVVMAFSQYMPQKGGVFHHLILKLDEDTVTDLELDWLIPILGDWPAGVNKPVNPPSVLVTAK
jgi:DNA-directed RNA polymerase specialized sigma subunit